MSFKEVLEVHGYPLISKETAAKIRKLREIRRKVEIPCGCAF